MIAQNRIFSIVTRFFPFLAAAICSIAIAPIAARAAAQPSPSSAGRPLFDPERFFTGRTFSWGVIENRGGAPTEVVTTETSGNLVHGQLDLEQTLHVGNKPPQHRSWKLRRIDPRHYQATANDMLGAARGIVTGNVFSWTFTLALKPGNALFNVRMTQYMYLQPDGATMVNRSVIRKFGLVIGEVTEEFHQL